jgi:hypothetical protein
VVHLVLGQSPSFVVVYVAAKTMTTHDREGILRADLHRRESRELHVTTLRTPVGRVDELRSLAVGPGVRLLFRCDWRMIGWAACESRGRDQRGQGR